MICGMEETAQRVEERSAAYVLDVPIKSGKLTDPKPKRNKNDNLIKGPGPGRPKGIPNKLTQSLRSAVEMAAQDCHPHGLAGWLVERANGSLGDRQIFAGVVSKVIPLQVNASVQGGISINLGWLGARGIGTNTAQAHVIDAQVIDSIGHSPSSQRTTDALPADEQGEGQGG